MTIRHLKTFIAVCESGGITKAAEALHIAQPAVSQTIAEIEKYYKVVLFDRINHRLVLSDYGKQLLVKAKETIASFDDFESLANENNLNARIRIGSSLTIGKEYIPKVVTLITEHYPQIKVSVIIDSTAVIEGQLTNGNLDFAFVEGNIHSKSLVTEIIAHDRLLVVCGNQYIIPENITLNKLVLYPMLLRENGSASRNYLNSILSVNGLTANCIVESASNQALIACAENNLGIAVLPRNIVNEYVTEKRLRVIKIDKCNFDRNYYFVHHKNKRFSLLQEKVITACKNLF